MNGGKLSVDAARTLGFAYENEDVGLSISLTATLQRATPAEMTLTLPAGRFYATDTALPTGLVITQRSS